jgi:hypothetical protein
VSDLVRSNGISAAWETDRAHLLGFSRLITGRMRFLSRSASPTSQSQISERAEGHPLRGSERNQTSRNAGDAIGKRTP